MAHATAHAVNTVGILPDALYARDAFVRASGISKSRIREARLQGVTAAWFNVGKRQYIRGRDAIAFIERLAELQSQATGAGA